jgi:DHA2 family methylenomycin A resistance protein-like MFS transporter
MLLYTERRGKVLTLVALSLGLAVVQLDVTVVNVAVKQIEASIGGGLSVMQWVLSAYTLAFAALILTAGALGDRLGSKRLFIAGFTIFTSASIACGLAPGIAVLIAARAVQGIGAAVLVACSLAILNHSYHDPAERAKAVGWWAAGASTALAAGPVVGGLLIAVLGWRSIFFINVPIGLVGIWLTVRHASETPRSLLQGVDLPGQLAAVITLSALAAAMIEGGSLGWTSVPVLIGFAISALAGATFVVIEAHTPKPMLSLALFRNATFSSTTVIGLLVNICFYGLIFVFSILLQRDQGRSALSTGLAFLPMTAAIMAANLVAGRLARVIGAAKLIQLGLIVMAAACLGLMSAGPHSAYPAMAAQMVALGAGLGLMVPPMTASLLGSVDRTRSGIASGTLNSMRQTGSVIGVALFGSLIANASQTAQGLHLALAASIILLLTGCMLARRIATERR